MKLLIIDNSKEAAVMEGTWKNPGASLYNTLLDSFYYKNGKIPNDAKELDQAIKNGEYLQWSDYLKEAYLIAPVNQIKNSPYGVTPYSRSGCKYPHHVIRNNKLVLSKKGILAAYSRAKQMGIYKGNVKEHIDSHLKELGFDIDDKKLMESVLEENFDDIFDLLNIRKDYFSEDRYFDILHSDLDENHKQKKQRFLSEFHQKYITKSLTKKYANDGNLIKYMRDQNPKYDDTCLIWIDDEDNYVCAITFDSKPADDGHKWISGIDVSYKYRSCGLGKEMIEYAKTQGVDALSVQYDNSVAIKLYKNCGFEISKESKEKVENGSENTYDMFLKKNSLDDNKDSIDIEKFHEMVDEEYQQLKMKNPLSISNFGIIHNEFSIYRDPDFYLKEKASLNAINKLINKGIHKIKKRMNFVTSKKSLAKIQMLDRFDSNKFYDNSCVFGTNIPLLIFKDKINNVKKITESFDNLSQQYYLSESFICESVTEEQIITIRKRLQNELKANILFLNEKSNMKRSKEIRDMIGPCSVIETNRSTIMKIWTGNDTDLAFIPNRFNSKDLDFERVILVNPEIIMGYPNISERGIELLIKHEYGHILTFDKVSDYDWAEYNLKRNFLNRIIEEISKYSALISVNTNKENINACYLYHHLYLEDIADKAVNIDKTEFIRNLHGIDPSMNLYSLNSSKYINYKIPKEILDLVLKEMSLKCLSIEEAKSMSDFYIDMCKSLDVPKIIVNGLINSLNTFENKIQENSIQFISDYNEEIQNELEWIDKFVHNELFRESCDTNLLLNESPKIFNKKIFNMDNNILGKSDFSIKDLFEWFKNNISYDHANPSKWKLKSPEETYKFHKGNCHDQSLLSYTLLKIMGFTSGQIFFIEYKEKNNITGNAHTFTWYIENNKYYWFETSWENKAGIHGPYDSIIDLKEDVKKEWNNDDDINSRNYSDIYWDGIKFSDKSKYKVGMDFKKYIKSWSFNEKINESYNNLFEEKSHGKLQYCYRIGFDISTGKEVAVQFDLDPSASYLLNKDMENQIYQNGVEKLNKNISKFGHIDFISSPLKVNAIFTRDGESMNSVKLVPLFSKGIIDLMNKFVQVHKELIIDEKLPSSKELFANPQFQKAIVNSSSTIPYEEYKIGKFSGKEGYGKDKYKTTKLLWDRDLFLSYKYTPVIRGYNKYGRGNNLIDKLNYIDNEMNNKFKESYEGDIELFNSMVNVKTNQFEEESISGFISGISFYEHTNEGWFRSKNAEDVYFEAIKRYEDSLYFTSKESDPKKHNELFMEEGENMDQQQTDEKPQSMPKQTDAKESSKNGVRRKKLYIAFIEWCKEYNNKNTFGSIFDKDAFNVTYPFIPEEMRYFYRLANPILCVLAGNLTFFQVSELRKLNSKNSKMNEMMIFAATETDFRVFNKKDKKVYRAIDKDGALTLMEPLGATFDIYIQNMIKKGDILNSPLNESMDFNYSEEDIEEIHENYERAMRESHKESYKAKFIGEWLK